MSKDSYQQERATLLEEIIARLSSDERFAAVWLSGSLGRFVNHWPEELHKKKLETEHLIKAAPREYQRGSASQIQTTRVDLHKSLRRLCDQMHLLRIDLAQFIGEAPALPQVEIEVLLEMAK